MTRRMNFQCGSFCFCETNRPEIHQKAVIFLFKCSNNCNIFFGNFQSLAMVPYPDSDQHTAKKTSKSKGQAINFPLLPTIRQQVQIDRKPRLNCSIFAQLCYFRKTLINADLKPMLSSSKLHRDENAF